MKMRRTLLLNVRPSLAAILFLILSVVAVSAQRPSAAWGTIPSPNAGFGPNELFDVDVLSANDIWAVGNFGIFSSPEPQVQHWDGVSWRVVPLPSGFAGDLLGVAAVAANDVWFVGGAASTGETFIFHWDGTSISQVTSPNPGSYNRLYDVVALAANDVWAVGEYASGGVSKTLIEHWDGTKWSVVSSPTSRNEYTQLLGVAAVAPNDIWAVGEAGSNTYTLHWNGTAWTLVDSPKVSFSSFEAVSATAAGEVWAVGKKSGGTLTERWTGQAWEVVASPSPGSFTNELDGVVILAPNDIWAVGTYDQSGSFKTLALHWNGVQWTQVASDSPDPSFNTLNAVDADDLNTLWAVGIAAEDSLAMHWDGTSWTIVPTPDFPLDAPLQGVTAIASNDVWAVGFQTDPATLNSSTVILH